MLTEESNSYIDVDNFKDFNFVKNTSSDLSTDKNNNGDLETKIKKSFSNIFNSSNNIIIPDDKIIDQDHNVNEMLNCLKINKSPLTDIKSIKLNVSDPKLIKGGLFSRDYTVYTISCSELSSVVYRRYGDFEWLRTELKRQFPNNYVRIF
jgi:hypothetical protein